jgi:DNA modification methylase
MIGAAKPEPAQDKTMNNGADEEMVDHIRRLIEAGLSRELDMPLSLDACVPAPTLNAFLERLAAYVTERRVQEAFSNGDAPGDNGDPSEQHPRNRLNDLTGAEWLWFTKSVMRTTYPSILGHEIRKRQGGNKPPQLMQELIEFFSKRGDLVLDPFGGAGGTALGAHLAGRRSLSIELNPASIALYHAVCEQENLTPHPFIQGDCREVLPTLEDHSVDFIATDPPYSPELEQTMSGEEASILYGHSNRRSSYVPYSDDPRDLSKLGSFEAFFDALDEVGAQMLRVLKPRRYLAMILRDAYQGGEYIHTSAIVAERYRALGWRFKGEKIWYSTGTRIRPYGYPSAYVPNIIHQNILIFRKD